jgi:hypothetical protein
MDIALAAPTVGAKAAAAPRVCAPPLAVAGADATTLANAVPQALPQLTPTASTTEMLDKLSIGIGGFGSCAVSVGAHCNCAASMNLPDTSRNRILNYPPQSRPSRYTS